ncbi:MAG: dihydroneopterin aldolase [Chloroflexi bacterium]|nr:dihydroneopterin aldolase [Chloroflexota bacterium]
MAQRDIIRLEGLVFFGRHGARSEEQSLGQQFEVDIEMQADLSKARASDRLAETIDYGKVYETVRQIMEGPSRNLLERLAEEVATTIIAAYKPDEVKVVVRKPRLPILKGVLKGVSVEVRKSRA